jgi:hypothetical protein
LLQGRVVSPTRGRVQGVVAIAVCNEDVVVIVVVVVVVVVVVDVFLPFDAQEEAVEEDEDCDGALEVEVLGDVVDEGLKAGALRFWWNVERLSDL